MDSVQLKYSNFQSFCNDVVPKNEFALMLSSAPLELFLATIRLKKGQFKAPEDIMKAVIEKGNIDVTTLSKENVEKFIRYIQYFSEVVSI